VLPDAIELVGDTTEVAVPTCTAAVAVVSQAGSSSSAAAALAEAVSRMLSRSTVEVSVCTASSLVVESDVSSSSTADGVSDSLLVSDTSPETPRAAVKSPSSIKPMLSPVLAKSAACEFKASAPSLP